MVGRRFSIHWMHIVHDIQFCATIDRLSSVQGGKYAKRKKRRKIAYVRSIFPKFLLLVKKYINLNIAAQYTQISIKVNFNKIKWEFSNRKTEEKNYYSRSLVCDSFWTQVIPFISIFYFRFFSQVDQSINSNMFANFEFDNRFSFSSSWLWL